MANVIGGFGSAVKKRGSGLRTTGYDVMPKLPKAKKPEPFNIPASRVPVLDHLHNVRAHVGKSATDATVSRFLGRRGATLQTVQGRKCWVGITPKK